MYTAPWQTIPHLRSVFRSDNGLIHFQPSPLCDLELAVLMMAASYDFPTADLDRVYTKSLAEVGLLVNREFLTATNASLRTLVRNGSVRRLCLC